MLVLVKNYSRTMMCYDVYCFKREQWSSVSVMERKMGNINDVQDQDEIDLEDEVLFFWMKSEGKVFLLSFKIKMKLVKKMKQKKSMVLMYFFRLLLINETS